MRYCHQNLGRKCKTEVQCPVKYYYLLRLQKSFEMRSLSALLETTRAADHTVRSRFKPKHPVHTFKCCLLTDSWASLYNVSKEGYIKVECITTIIRELPDDGGGHHRNMPEYGSIL